MKDKYPKISIVTPSYNQADFLETTINSVLSQNYPNLEYIIIDGGSRDKSVEIIKKYEKYLSYWESRKDQGQSYAINKGFQKSTGDIMAWINSDDIYHPGALKLVASVFTTFPEISWLTSLPNTITPDGYVNYMSQTPIYWNYFIKKGWYIKKLFGFIMQEGTFWRRALWVKTGGKLEHLEYSLDLKLWQNFAQYEKLIPINACLASYRLNPNRKNRDDHANYYREIGYSLPDPLAMGIKYFWRQYIELSEYFQITPSIYYSEDQQKWLYRKNKFDQKEVALINEI